MKLVGYIILAMVCLHGLQTYGLVLEHFEQHPVKFEVRSKVVSEKTSDNCDKGTTVNSVDRD